MIEKGALQARRRLEDLKLISRVDTFIETDKRTA